MRVAFFHDTPLIKAIDKQVYSVGFSYSIWQRYLDVFDSMIVSTRMRYEETETNTLVKNLSISSGPRVDFQPIDAYSKNWDMIFNRKKIKKQVRETLEQVECAIIRLPSSIGIIACKEAIKMGKPYLVEVVGCAWDAMWNHGSLLGKIVAPYSFVSNRFSIRKSNYTIYITKFFLQKRYPTLGKSCVCPNVNIENVDRSILKKKLYSIDNRSIDDTIVFGLIGSLDVSYKGHETVIKAFSIIKEKIPNFRIEFLGGGDPQRWIRLAKKYEVDEHLKFLGTLPSGNQVHKWIDTIDISLQPSAAEAQGRSIIEAMSRGCPIISSNVGGIIELIEKDWRIDANNYIELSNKIMLMISDSSIQKVQSEKNFNEAKQYSKENISVNRKSFLELFKKEVVRIGDIN